VTGRASSLQKETSAKSSFLCLGVSWRNSREILHGVSRLCCVQQWLYCL